ncbi:hypothetical protein KR018_002656, partial [Drosophila ironensis]
MDFHILIVIGCVFTASLLSFLFINKIFRRKTFEEVVAEKRALNANLYKAAGGAAAKKPKKKELKREKKQRQREQQRDANNEPEAEEVEDYSDGQSEGQGSVADDEPGLSKQHVEFEPDAEILNEQRRPSSVAEKENQPAVSGKKGKKDKRNGAGNNKATGGILVNKNETVAVVKAPSSEETPTLNNFEAKAPKDVVELKKQEQKERKEDNNNTKQQAQKKNGAGNVAKKEKPAAPEPEVVTAPKILKQQQQQNGSPKTQHNQVNNKTKQQHKQKQKETLTAKDLAQALDKLAEYQNQTIGVNALINVFSRAELNRSEIQILIDYLLNKQQDMPASHSEWSDDICQKLKRQLEEKEKLLSEEQEASIGIQAKLRELRQEVNTERAQMHSRIQAYNDKLQAKEQELAAVNQELTGLNDKLTLERQQFQTLLREKQANSQELVPQLQRLQQDLAHKEKCLADMTAFVNAETQQKNEVIQQQAQQLLALEQQRDELEQRQNNSIFELEQRKQLEQENAELKQELRTLTQAQSELQRVHTAELQELRKQSTDLEAGNQALKQQLSQAANSAVQATAAQSEQAQVQSEALAQKQQELSALRSQLGSLTDAQAQQQKQATALQSQLQEAQKRAEQLQAKEKQLQQELQEQKEKNNEVRMKNWKLIEALQNAEASTAKKCTKTNTAQSLGQQHKELQQQKQQLNGGGTASSAKSEQQRIRDLYLRLYPDAVKAQAGSALQASFDQWLEQVLATHVKQQAEKLQKQSSSSSHKSTQSNSSSSSNHNNSTHNNISSNNSSSNRQSPSADALAVEKQELHKQNLQLRECNDKLTQLVTKTVGPPQSIPIDFQSLITITLQTNTLLSLEDQAREQDEHWRGIVEQKEQQILKLQQHASNGE